MTTCTPKNGEPSFTLLGRDRHAAALVEMWAILREADGEDPAVTEEAKKRAEEMRAYAMERSSKENRDEPMDMGDALEALLAVAEPA